MSWVNDAVTELDKLPEPHREKKRATIIALVDARISGVSEETVWKRHDTCARSTYHGKWRHDPLFAQVLENVYATAQRWNDEKAIRALQQAAERLALASPVAVARAIERLNSTDEGVVLRAAFGILDRAGVETATKSSSTTKHELSDDVETALNRIYGDDSDSDGDETETE